MASISVEKFRDLEECGLRDIQVKNKLSGDEFQHLVGQAAVVFQGQNSSYKLPENFRTTTALS